MTYRNIKFIGDLHCSTAHKTMMTAGSIQLGDLCVVEYKHRFSFNKESVFGTGKRFFIDGNHDRFPVLKPDLMELQEVATNLVYIPRGHVSGKTLFIGGGDSIDKDIRTPGCDWFPEEGLGPQQFNRIMDINQKIEVIVSHDCPERIVPWIRSRINPGCSHFRLGLNHIFEKFHPDLWIFAHHHKPFDQTLHGCRFVCVNTARFVKFDVPINYDIIA